jgi:hypothetical protein
VAVRIVVTDRAVFRELIGQVGVVCTIYAAYFLLDAHSYDLINHRATVSFANANYAGAILSFGVAVTAYLAFTARPGTDRIFYIASVLLEMLAIYESGSRSSFAGAALALLVLALWRRAGRWVRPGVLVAAVIGFLVALAPSSIDLFARVAAYLAPFGTFQRGLESAQDASGRQQIWIQARGILNWAWLTGWGPGNYFRPIDEEEPTFLSHSWAMEYLLSVGVLGTIFIAIVLYLAYTRSRGGLGALWTAQTMASLLPSLVFSTHQWTLWAWFAFALWSRADLLGGSSARSDVDPPVRPGTT